MTRRLLAFLLGMATATPGAAQTTYDIIAYEAKGIDPSDTTPIMRDARAQLPRLLRSCGLRSFRNLPATDGAVVYRFSADPQGEPIDCIRKNLPSGALLHP